MTAEERIEENFKRNKEVRFSPRAMAATHGNANSKYANGAGRVTTNQNRFPEKAYTHSGDYGAAHEQENL